jgi:precorrin-2 dehydrogenase/sirohydrochlorin ferrochelatase
MFLKLDGRRCLVVGAGAIAAQKIDALLAAGAQVTVIAPEASEHIRAHALEKHLTWIARAFEPEDIEGATLVVAATGEPGVNQQVFRCAEQRGVLCNAVDDAEHCHFYYPAVVRRGDLQIAISTAGHSPALAQRLRSELESLFGDEYGDWLRWLGAVRRKLFRREMDPQRRRTALHRIASREVFERYRRARQRREEER